jgi:drug/metabolite transporter (DMT)-like permease
MPPPSPPQLSVTTADWLLLVALSLLWGASFYFAKVAVLEIPPLTLALGRVAIAAAVLAAVAWVIGGPFPRDPLVWRDFAVMAIFNAVLPFTLIFWGQIHISIGLAAILNATSPLFSVLIAHAMTRDDKLTGPRVIGLAAGFVGVVVLIGPDLLGEFGTHALAELACLAASLFYAIGAIYTRRLRTLSPFTVATGQLTMSALILLPVVLLFDRPAALGSASSAALSALIALAVFSTAVGYLLYFRILSRAGATNALLVTFLIPVSAILLGLLLLEEAIEPRQLAGMTAIAFGLAAIDGRPARLITQRFNRTTS